MKKSSLKREDLGGCSAMRKTPFAYRHFYFGTSINSAQRLKGKRRQQASRYFKRDGRRVFLKVRTNLWVQINYFKDFKMTN